MGYIHLLIIILVFLVYIKSIIRGDFSKVRGGFRVFVKHAAVDGFAINYPVIVRVHSRDNFTF